MVIILAAPPYEEQPPLVLYRLYPYNETYKY